MKFLINNLKIIKNITLLNITKFVILGLLFNTITKRFVKLKVLLCTIGKEENKYIKEFVNHYRKLKIEKIILYDNNDINGENFKDILNKEIFNNFVEIINFRGFKNPQVKAVFNCYKNYSKKYDWIAFYDIDEFLQIRNYNNINKFLSLPKFKKCQSIIINWRYY